MAAKSIVLTKRLGIVGVLTLLLSGCVSSGYTWGWFAVSPGTSIGRRNLLFLIKGLVPTISISAISVVISVVIGLVVALLGLSNLRVLRTINRLWVEAFRSVPVLVMLLWSYYGLPITLGIDLDIFTAGVVALALCDSAFEAEIFRGGIQSIPRSQTEAANLMGCTPYQTLRFVILPQAVRHILPPLGNQFAYMLKISSLVSVIGLGELTRKANELTVIEYRPLEIYSVLIFEYLVLIIAVSHLVRRMEKRLAPNQQD
jgi:His/Glu/Gln/Arg/opine family amino acid ABC transporter permease subunit